MERLESQMAFIVEIDKLKQVQRQSRLIGENRRENDAEHSWHLAMLAITLAEYAAEPVDVLRVVRMVLVHDIVEIDAGDAFCYDAQANVGKEERERCAAERIFGLLPEGQGRELRELWEEFEAQRTAEARFAAALDRVQPLLLNFFTQGEMWREKGIRYSQVLARNQSIAAGAPRLWEYVRVKMDDAVAKGWLKR